MAKSFSVSMTMSIFRIGFIKSQSFHQIVIHCGKFTLKSANHLSFSPVPPGNVNFCELLLGFEDGNLMTLVDLQTSSRHFSGWSFTELLQGALSSLIIVLGSV